LRLDDEELPLAITYKNRRFNILDTHAEQWTWTTNIKEDEGEPVTLLEMILKHENGDIRRFEYARHAIVLEIGGDRQLGKYIPSYGYRRQGRQREEMYDDIIY